MINFPFGTNGKLIIISVPILKHFRVMEIDSEPSNKLLLKLIPVLTIAEPACYILWHSMGAGFGGENRIDSTYSQAKV